MSKIYCLILKYNRKADTLQAGRSLLASNLPRNTKILVIDNGPRSLATYFSKYLPQAKYFKNSGNIGFAAGNNVGIKYALAKGATHILIMNPDVTVPKSFLPRLIHTLALHKQAGLIAPAHSERVGSYGLGGHINWRNASFPHDNTTTLPRSPRPYDLLTFACVLIKREVFEVVGLMDERYFLYLEDVDYCVSAKRAGFKLYLDPRVVVKHQTSSSFADPRGKIKFSFQSSFIFIRKWYRFPGNLIPLLHTWYFYPSLYVLWTAKAWKQTLKQKLHLS